MINHLIVDQIFNQFETITLCEILEKIFLSEGDMSMKKRYLNKKKRLKYIQKEVKKKKHTKHIFYKVIFNVKGMESK